MIVIDTKTRKKHKVEILPVESEDFKLLTKKRYFFNWETEKKYELYKLRIEGTTDILGLVSIERIPKELRIHIRLLTVSNENRGKTKSYENIAGNLITYVSKLAIKEYAEYACVSLKPKSEISKHYIDKFGMNKTGLILSVEINEIMNLINTYDYE